MDIAQIRQDIADLIGQVADEISVYPFAEDNPVVPAAIIYPEQHELVDTYQAGRTVNFVLMLLVPTTNTASGQERLDGWISTGNPESMVDQINTNPPPASCSSLMAKTLRSYGTVTLQDGGTRYLAAEVVIEAICD